MKDVTVACSGREQEDIFVAGGRGAREKKMWIEYGGTSSEKSAP